MIVEILRLGNEVIMIVMSLATSGSLQEAAPIVDGLGPRRQGRSKGENNDMEEILYPLLGIASNRIVLL